MGGISTSLTLHDKMTNIFNRQAAAADRLINRMSKLDAATENFNPGEKIKNSTPPLKQYDQQQKQVEAGAKRVANETGKWRNKIVTAASAVSLIQAGYQAISKAMEKVDESVSFSARLDLINDGSQTQDQLRQMIYQAAQNSRGDFGAMSSSVAKLGMLAGDAFGNNAEIVQFTELLNKSFVLSGASAQESTAAMYQLTQAMAAGKLQGDEFSSIMENAPMLASAIAKYMGKSKGELKKLSAQGEITSDIIKNAMFSTADEVNEKFEKMPKTWASMWTGVKNKAMMAFQPLIKKASDFLNSSRGQQLFDGISSAIARVANTASWAFDAVVNALIWAQDHAQALKAVFIAVGIVAAAAGIAAFVAWLTATWPILLIIAAIALVIYALMEMGVKFEDICGAIGAIVGWLVAFIWNLVVDCWNLIAVVAENIANVFVDPTWSIARLFIDLADVVLGIIETIADAIDAIFGSNLADAVTGWRNDLAKWSEETFGAPEVEVPRLEKMDASKTAVDWFEGGRSFGKGVEGISEGLKNLDSVGNILASNMGTPDVGTVGQVNKINDDISISDEDMKYLRDLAQVQYVNKFTTLRPEMKVTFGDVRETADTEAIMEAIEDMAEQALASVLVG